MATIEIDGKKIDVEPGKMIIEVADDAGIHIPRFCYHKKLSVAANCRMCLVDVEKARKPMPACATPVTDGMKVSTQSEVVKAAQKAIMEFLLINHPLDCPICDQGGECELQDVSMTYGQDVSHFDESKRVVSDPDLGPLISTELTRCIHCTRCVRFGEEIAGVRELGATGRGEHTTIGTFVKHMVNSEVSGNVIDLCPVGALTAKPSRFQARPWELQQYPSIAPHDCLGSHVDVHVRRNDVVRVVPRAEDTLNEVWLSDRDRFSYAGLSSKQRLKTPKIKRSGQWVEVSWHEALDAVVSRFKQVITKEGPERVKALCSNTATVEEAYLLQKVMRGLGVNALDHRLQETDFSDQSLRPVLSAFEKPYQSLDTEAQILLLGSNLLQEQPLAALRVRKAINSGSIVSSINTFRTQLNAEFSHELVVSPNRLVETLAQFVRACTKGLLLSETDENTLSQLVVCDDVLALASDFDVNKPFSIILGAAFTNHPKASELRTLLSILKRYREVYLLPMTDGPNALGCAIAGVLPHQGPCGKALENQSNDSDYQIHTPSAAYFMMGFDPSFDVANPKAMMNALMASDCVVMMTAFTSKSMETYADIMLPIAPFTETSGTYINCEAKWQSFKGCIKPPMSVRPAWKVLRVLGNYFNLPGFDYEQSDEVLTEVKAQFNRASDLTKGSTRQLSPIVSNNDALSRIGSWPLYRSDQLVRHSEPLQQLTTHISQHQTVKIHPNLAKTKKLGEYITVTQGEIEITFPVQLSADIPEDAIFIPCGLEETVDLGAPFAHVTIK